MITWTDSAVPTWAVAGLFSLAAWALVGRWLR